MEFASCHVCGTWNFEVVLRFLEIHCRVDPNYTSIKKVRPYVTAPFALRRLIYHSCYCYCYCHNSVIFYELYETPVSNLEIVYSQTQLCHIGVFNG